MRMLRANINREMNDTVNQIFSFVNRAEQESSKANSDITFDEALANTSRNNRVRYNHISRLIEETNEELEELYDMISEQTVEKELAERLDDVEMLEIVENCIKNIEANIESFNDQEMTLIDMLEEICNEIMN